MNIIILQKRKQSPEDMPSHIAHEWLCQKLEQVCLTPQLLVRPSPPAHGWHSWQAMASHNGRQGCLSQSLATSPEETKPLSETPVAQERSL